MESKHPYRTFCFEKFKELITEQNKILKTKIKQTELIKKIINLEKGIFNYSVRVYISNPFNKTKTWNDDFEYIYRERFRHVYFNLLPSGKGSLKNENLIKRYLIHKEFDEEYLCEYMTAKEMFPEFWSRINHNKYQDLDDYIRFKKLQDDRDGLLKCGKCKSYKTEYTEKQTRSADEPTTKFCYCRNCGNRWKFC